MIRTYVDADVLIAAARGDEELSTVALAILEDPEREFVSSLFLRMETSAPTSFHNRTDQLAFYEEFFKDVVAWVTVDQSLVEAAHEHCRTVGVHALDALHVAAAASAGADELITSEKPTSNMLNVTSVKVASIRPTVK